MPDLHADAEVAFMWDRLESLEDESRRRHQRARQAEAENERLREQLRIATETMKYLSHGTKTGKTARHMSNLAEDALIRMSVVE